MNRIATAALILGLGALGQVTLADEAADRKALLTALPTAKISLQKGLEASASTGTPVSAKFEIDDGHLQLSVYTRKGAAFSEVIVDHLTGKIGKSEPITGGEDLAAANKQAHAMTKAKLSLADAVGKAENESAGFQAISATAATSKGHGVAKIQLHNGDAVKTATIPLE